MSNVKLCVGCCHPAYMHRHGGGCHAGLYAANTSVLSFTGCSCAHSPDDCGDEPRLSGQVPEPTEEI